MRRRGRSEAWRAISSCPVDSILSDRRTPSEESRARGLSKVSVFRRLAPRLPTPGDRRVEFRGFLAMAIAARGVLDHLRRIASQDTDDQVRGWRRHWRRGAEARWSGASSGDHRYPAGSSQASAWCAGWRWADHHADRRQPNATRLAHPYRRNSDTLVRLVRRTNARAVGVSALRMIAAVWEIRRRRGRAS